MPPQDAWTDLIPLIRASNPPQKSPHLKAFYALAITDGTRFLSSFARDLGDDRLLDLIHDVLATSLSKVLAADVPRAYFCRAVQNRARDWVARGDAAIAETPPDSAPGALTASSDAGEESRRAFVLDAREALASMSERDRGIVLANAHGEDVETIATEFGVSVDNVYAVVSRARKRFHRETP